MSAPRARHSEGSVLPSGNVYLSKDQFKEDTRYSASSVYFSLCPKARIVMPFIWAKQNGDYVQLPYVGQLDALAQYVDDELAKMEARLSAQEAAAGSSKDKGEQHASAIDALRREIAAGATSQAERLAAIDTTWSLKSDALSKALAGLEAAIRTELDDVAVIIHGVSGPTKAASAAFATAKAIEEKAAVNLEGVQKLVASGAPIDTTAVKAAYDKAHEETSACKAALELAEARDARARAQHPEDAAKKMKFENAILRRVVEALAVSKKPFQDTLEEINASVARLSTELRGHTTA